MTLDDVRKHIETETPMAFSRWGDGEWQCMLSYGTQNCDEHPYYESLSDRLKTILSAQPDYYLGLQGKAWQDMHQDIMEFEELYAFDHNKWCDADIFHDASIRGEFLPFMRCLNEKYKHAYIMVGPQYLGEFSLPEEEHSIWGSARHVVIPRRCCWLSYEHTKGEIITLIQDAGEAVLPILYCASMMSKVLIDDIWNMFPNTIQLDLGSVLDPYCGVSSRRYHNKIIQREKGGMA